MIPEFDFQILNNKKPIELHKGSCIYFLFKNDEVVYVGQSKLGLSRLYEHCMNKDFDAYSYVPVDNEGDLNYIEAMYIHLFKPIYNKNIPSIKYDHQKHSIISHGITRPTTIINSYAAYTAMEKSKPLKVGGAGYCPICGTVFSQGRGHRGAKKYCSLACAYKRRRGKHTNKI